MSRPPDRPAAADFAVSAQFQPSEQFESSRQFGEATQLLTPVSLHESVVFLARFLGTPVQLERLRDTLMAQRGSRGDTVSPDALRRLVAHAGLVSSALPRRRARRATEMPALVLGEGGRSLVVVAMKDGQFECHLPGIEGSSWLDADALALEVPSPRWFAVRPRLYFDQRSLLYALPEPARWFWGVFRRNQWIFNWALAGTLALNVFGALVPFYSMAVYDRVIPNNAIEDPRHEGQRPRQRPLGDHRPERLRGAGQDDVARELHRLQPRVHAGPRALHPAHVAHGGQRRAAEADVGVGPVEVRGRDVGVDRAAQFEVGASRGDQGGHLGVGVLADDDAADGQDGWHGQDGCVRRKRGPAGGTGNGQQRPPRGATGRHAKVMRRASRLPPPGPSGPPPHASAACAGGRVPLRAHEVIFTAGRPGQRPRPGLVCRVTHCANSTGRT